MTITMMMMSRTTPPTIARIHHGNFFGFGWGGTVTSKATDGPSVKSSSGSISETASSLNEYDPIAAVGGTWSATTTRSAAFGANSRTDSPTTENHSGFAGPTGLASSRPLSVCTLMFVTVNDACAAPFASRVTLWPAEVTVKLDGRPDIGQPRYVTHWTPISGAKWVTLIFAKLPSAECTAKTSLLTRTVWGSPVVA